MAYINENGNGPRAGRTTGRQRMTLANLRSKQTYTGLPDPGFVAGYTSQMAALAQQYQSRLAALRGQTTNIKSQYAMNIEAARAQQVAGAVAAEGSAVERGVLGGSADVKNRIAVAAEASAMQQQAAVRKQSALAEVAASGMTASNQYLTALAALQADKAAAMANENSRLYAGGMMDPTKKIQGEDNAQVWMNHHRDELTPYYSVAASIKPGETEAWRRIGKKMAAEFYGWGEAEFAAIDEIVMGESEWDPRVVNDTKPAYGIAQTMMNAHFGPDWKSDPAARRLMRDPIYQIAWMYNYIMNRYGSPQAALQHKRSKNWY